MEFNFTNKVVLITGASVGIGEDTAILFAKYGARLALVGRNEKKLRDVASRCEKEKGVTTLAIIEDLSTDEGCERTAKYVPEHFGRLDILVNNAAIGARACLERTDMITFDRVFDLDVRGVYNLTRLLAPALIKTKGNVVNVSSVSATVVAVGSLPYSMAKASLDHFTRLIALELAPKGVRVNSVSPGVTESKFFKLLPDYTDDQYNNWLKGVEGTIPMGQACNGEDIARMIVFLSSDNCRLVTGTTVEVDGGIRFKGVGSVIGDQMK